VLDDGVVAQPTYFTSSILGGERGIGDQLYQLQVLYNLGRHAGWQYVHDVTPTAWVNRDRANVPTRFDYHDFLGLPREERRLADFADVPFVELEARELLGRLLAGSPLPDARGVRLRFDPWFYDDYEHEPPERALPCRYRLDLARKYALARDDDPVALPFDAKALPIVVFLRVMELAFYEHEGRVVVPCFAGDPLVSGYVNPPSRVLPLLQSLFEALGSRPREVWVYSDGLPDRAWLAGRIAARGVDARVAESEAERALAFQRAALAELSACGANVTFRVNGSIELTREIVHAFAVAPFVLNSRACRLGRHGVRTGFPDLGQRPAGLFPVITPDTPPRALAEAVRRHLETR
jgi:hypothetical protein